MFTYQKDTKSLFVAECGKKDFWREIRKSSTAFNIDTRREILHAVDAQDEVTLLKWAEHTDFQKFELKTLKGLKTKTGKEKWQNKPLDKKLLAWADDLKKSLTAFQFCCYQFDEATVKTKDGKTKKGARRVLKGCHLNGLVMLDIDHVENPMEVWEKLQKCEALMARVVLVHITSSGHGIRIIFIADRQIGNLADQQISFAAVLGYSPDQSCIDATRNSFAPKEDEILFIDEKRLFTYYDEEFDREFTPQYRDKKTQPLHHKFPSDAAEKMASDKHGLTRTSSPDAENNSPSQSVKSDAEIKWRGYDIQRIIDARYAATTPIVTKKVSNWPQTCCSCSMVTSNWCSASWRASRGYRRSSTRGMRTSPRLWRVLPVVSLKRKRSTCLLCPRRQCSPRFRNTVARRIRRSRKRRRRR